MHPQPLQVVLPEQGKLRMHEPAHLDVISNAEMPVQSFSDPAIPVMKPNSVVLDPNGRPYDNCRPNVAVPPDPILLPANDDLATIPALPEGEQSATGVLVKTEHRLSPIADIVAEIRATWRMRTALLNAERSLTLQIKAVERQVQRAIEQHLIPSDLVSPAELAAMATVPLGRSREPITAQKKVLEKRLEKLAKSLPAWAWAKDARGFGALMLAGIAGEAGDLSSYATPSRLWKRMGLAVIHGVRQGRHKDAELALLHGYSPIRRSLMWNLGECLVKLNQDGPYRTLYLKRKEYEVARNPDITKAHAHARAKRVMEKRALLDLWKVWHAAI